MEHQHLDDLETEERVFKDLSHQLLEIDTGEYSELPEMTGLTTFITTLACHCAAEAERR